MTFPPPRLDYWADAVALGENEGISIFRAGVALVCIPGMVSAFVADSIYRSFDRGQLNIEAVVQSIPIVGENAVASFAVIVLELGTSQHAPHDVMANIAVRGDAVVVIDRAGVRDEFRSEGIIPFHFTSVHRFSRIGIGAAHEWLTALPAHAIQVDSDLALTRAAGAWLTLNASGVHTALHRAVPSVEDSWNSDAGFPAPARKGRHAATDNVEESGYAVSGLHQPAGNEHDPFRSRFAPPGLTGEVAPPIAAAIPVEPAEPPVKRSLFNSSRSDIVPLPPGRRHRIRVGSAAPFDLRVPVFVGRNPRPESTAFSSEPPLLITVHSPGKIISATHLKIVQEGDHVIVSDLNSTNGTTVSRDGAARIKLRQGESIVTPPSSRIDIGDGVVIEIFVEG